MAGTGVYRVARGTMPKARSRVPGPSCGILVGRHERLGSAVSSGGPGYRKVQKSAKRRRSCGVCGGDHEPRLKPEGSHARHQATTEAGVFPWEEVDSSLRHPLVWGREQIRLSGRKMHRTVRGRASGPRSRPGEGKPQMRPNPPVRDPRAGTESHGSGSATNEPRWREGQVPKGPNSRRLGPRCLPGGPPFKGAGTPGTTKPQRCRPLGSQSGAGGTRHAREGVCSHLPGAPRGPSPESRAGP